MGARSTDLLLFRDRRYFRIVAEEKRLYYATTGPDGDLVDNGNASGFLNAVASAMSITYHKIMDGEDPTGSTWVDLRLIGEVVYYKRRGALRAAQQPLQGTLLLQLLLLKMLGELRHCFCD